MLLKQLPPENRCIIVGDFNVDILYDYRTIQFEPLATFEQVIAEATHYGSRGQRSLLDHIYIKNCEMKASGVLPTYYSDHDAVFLQI